MARETRKAESVLDAPEVPTRFRLWRHQWAGLVFLFAFPLLAICGVFGQAESRRVTAGPRWKMEVSYPEKIRHGQHGRILVTVRNLDEPRPTNLRLALDWSYLDQFTDLSFHPPLSSNRTLWLPGLNVGESAEVTIELRAGEFGSRIGHFRLLAEDQEELRVSIRTTVFP